VEVVAVRVGGLGTSDFTRLVAASEVIMSLLFTISTLFFVSVVVGDREDV